MPRSTFTLALEATSALDDQPTGIGRYVAELGQALIRQRPPDRHLCFVYRASRWRTRERLPGPASGVRRQLRSGAVTWPPPARLDAIICPSYRLVPWQAPPSICVVHDLYAALGFNHDEAQRARAMAAYGEIARRAAVVACVSRHTRQDFLDLFPAVPETRVRVIPPGLPSLFLQTAGSPPPAPFLPSGRPYVLFVGLGNPNKNLPRLLQAFARSGLGRQGTHDLVLAGPPPPPEAERQLARSVAELGLDGRVQRMGFVSDAELPGLYAGAAAFAFPSLYEGFGTPILEAMAMGTPVLTARSAACPETAHGHAVLAEPTDVDDLARGLEATVGMPPDRRAAARDYARSMTYDLTARGFYAVFDDLLMAR